LWYSVGMHNLTPAVKSLPSPQRLLLDKFFEASFNLPAFAKAAGLSHLDAAMFVADEAIQAVLDSYDEVVDRETERSTRQVRLLTLKTLAAALPSSTDLVEARRISALLVRITGGRPKTNRAQSKPPSAHPSPPSNLVATDSSASTAANSRTPGPARSCPASNAHSSPGRSSPFNAPGLNPDAFPSPLHALNAPAALLIASAGKAPPLR